MKKHLINNLMLLISLVILSNGNTQVDLNNGLVSYIPFNGNTNDLSGNGHHLSYLGTQVFSGIDRNMNMHAAMRFYGENGQAGLSFGTSLLNDLSEYSISFWLNLKEGISENMHVFGQDNLLEVQYATSPGRLRIYHPTSGTFAINLTSPFYNNWRHILITGNSTEMKVYINGVLEDTHTGNYSLGNNTNNTNIGSKVIDQTTNACLRGSFDDLRIYSRVLNNEEIAALYNSNFPEIAITAINGTTFCAGSDIEVDFTVAGSIQPANTYILQMSDAGGNFDIPIELDRMNNNNLSGTFNSSIPAGTPSGTSYRFRIVSTNVTAVSDVSSPVIINGVLGNIPSTSNYYFIGTRYGKNFYRSINSSGGGTAQTTCTANGGNLATVYDSTVNALFHYTSQHSNSRLYIGLNDLDVEGIFQWKSGATVNYTNWGVGQPDNSGNEDYVEIRGDNGTWNDIANTKTQPHLMELSPAGNDFRFCPSSSIQLSGTYLTGATYQWTGPNGFSSTDQNPLILNGQQANAGTYILKYTLGGCTASDSVNVIMDLLPNNFGESSQALPVSLMDSLIIHYPLDGDAVDASGNGINGTIVNGLLVEADRFGNPTGAIKLSGNNRHITVPAGTYFNGSSFTVSSWVNKFSNNSWSRIIDFGNGESNNNIIFALSNSTSGKPSSDIRQGTGVANNITSTNVLANNLWTHLTYTWTEGTGRIYINGNIVAEGAQPAPLNVMRNNNYIGRSNWSVDAYANASFDDIRIYKRLLTPEEIQNLVTYQPNPLSAYAEATCQGTAAQIFLVNSQPGVSYQLKDATTNANVGNVQLGTGDTLLFTTGVLNADTDFYFEAHFTMGLGSCGITTPTITVDVIELDAPTTVNDTVCNGGLLTLTASGAATGSSYNWYTTATGGTPLPGINGNTYTIDTNETLHFYVSVTNSYGCESPRTQVTAFVINPLNPPVDIISGLILHYKFDGDFNDYSGNNYNATPSGNISFVNDKDNNPSSAINSTATGTPGNNYLNAGNPAKIQQLTNQVTISVWIRQTQTYFGGGGYIPIITKWTGGNGIYLGLRMQNNSGNITNRVRWRVNATTYLESNTNVPVFDWHHIVCTYNGSQLKIYQNGVLTGTLNYSGSIANTGTNLNIGRQSDGNGSITFRGDLDQIKIYNRALNSNEIRTLFNDESVAFANTPLCDGEDDLTLTTFEFPGATYQWDGPNGFSSNLQNPPVIVAADSATYSGIYTLVITSAEGCISPAQTVNVTIHEIPSIPTVLNDTVCGSGNAVLTASGAPSDGHYLWYTVPVGGSPISGQTSSTLTINNLTATTSRYVSIIRNGCEGERAEVIAVYQNDIETGLQVNGSTVCSNESVAHVELIGSESGVTYQAFRNGSPVSQQTIGGGTITLDIDVSLLSLGNNTITFTAEREGCGAVSLNNTATITVYDLPAVNAGNDVDICEGQSVTLTATGATSYSWTNGISNGVAFTPLTTATYTVTGTDANGCMNSDQVTVTVNTAPNVVANASQTTICQGQSVTLFGSGATSYNWDNGVANGVAFTPSSTTTYTVTGLAGGCQETDQITITVLPIPTVSIDATTTTVCQGETVTLSGNGATNYNWNNGITDGVAFSPAATTSYTVTGTDANGCQNTAQITITVHALPVVNAGNDVDICEGQSVTLTATGATSYSWTNGISNGVAFTPLTTTTYTVTGTDANGCMNSDQVTVTVNTPPIVVANASQTTICQGQSVTLFGSGATSYNWDNGVVNGVAFTPSSTTTYTVTGLAGGCQANDQITITVLPIPTVSIDATTTTVCQGETVTLSGNGATNYDWNNGITDGVAFSPAATTSYTVTGTDANGCQNTAQITITVHALPVVNAGNDVGICEGQSVTLTATGATSYSWTNGISNGVAFTPLTTATYTVTGTDANGCMNSDQVTVTVNTAPNVVANASQTTICQGQSVTLFGSGATSYNWDNGVVNGVAFTPSSTTTYTVTGINNNGCVNTAQITIVVDDCLSIKSIDELQLAVYPNPVIDVFSVVYSAPFFYTIMDATGKILMTGNAVDQVTLDIRDYSSGIYFLSLKTKEGFVGSIKIEKYR